MRLYLQVLAAGLVMFAAASAFAMSLKALKTPRLLFMGLLGLVALLLLSAFLAGLSQVTRALVQGPYPGWRHWIPTGRRLWVVFSGLGLAYVLLSLCEFLAAALEKLTEVSWASSAALVLCAAALIPLAPRTITRWLYLLEARGDGADVSVSSAERARQAQMALVFVFLLSGLLAWGIGILITAPPGLLVLWQLGPWRDSREKLRPNARPVF